MWAINFSKIWFATGWLYLMQKWHKQGIFELYWPLDFCQNIEQLLKLDSQNLKWNKWERAFCQSPLNKMIKWAISVIPELRQKVMQFVIAEDSWAGLIYWCVDELILLHQEVKVVNLQAACSTLCFNYGDVCEFLGQREKQQPFTCWVFQGSGKCNENGK